MKDIRGCKQDMANSKGYEFVLKSLCYHKMRT